MSGVNFSGLLDSAKKVFNDVGSAVQSGVNDVKTFIDNHGVQTLRYVAIAAAVYFTAGLAMSAFAPTAAFAATMPGWGATGIFTSAASAMGMGGLGAAGSGLADAAADSAAGTVAGAGAGAVAAPITGGAADAGTVTAMGEGGAVTVPGAAAAATPAAALPAGAAPAGGSALDSGTSALAKVEGAKVASDAISGALSPSLQEQYAAEKKFQGAYFGEGGVGGSQSAPIVPAGGFNILPPKSAVAQPNQFAAAATGNTAPAPPAPPAPTGPPAPGVTMTPPPTGVAAPSYNILPGG